MIRKIIHIDDQKCNGCGLCVTACHEGAIGLAGGKARLLRDDYCDGLGDCLPACPTGAITFEEREAAAYDEVAVKARMAAKSSQKVPLSGGCPGSNARSLSRKPLGCPTGMPSAAPRMSNHLGQWPVQIKLAPTGASFFEGAHLLIAADCAAYAYANFHHDFMQNKITLIGCPKLDGCDYAEKLAAIIHNNTILSVTLARMEVPCCGGLENALKSALELSGERIPWNVVTITTDGKIRTA